MWLTAYLRRKQVDAMEVVVILDMEEKSFGESLVILLLATYRDHSCHVKTWICSRIDTYVGKHRHLVWLSGDSEDIPTTAVL